MNRFGRTALILIPLSFLTLFFVWPLSKIMWTALSGTEGLALEIATRPAFRSVAWFTLWQAIVSTVLTVVAALPAAYVFARFEFPGKALLRAAVTIPFVMPTLVVGTAFLALLGPQGALSIDLSETIWAILIAHVFYNYAVVVRTVGGLWAHQDPRLEEAARMLGASRFGAFRRVTLPLLRPAIAAASSIIFLFTFTSFGVIVILGGLRYRTIEVEIWRQTTAFLDLGMAAGLALVQLVAVSLILMAYSRYQERKTVEQNLRPAAEVARRPASRSEWTTLVGVLSFTGLLLGTPLVVLILKSLRTANGWGLNSYRALTGTDSTTMSVNPLAAVSNSLSIALIATVIALAIGIMAAAVVAQRRGPMSRWFDLLLMLPLGTSAVTIGFGLLIALDWPIDLRASPILVPLAHSLVAIPFVVRTVVPVMRSIQDRLREAAAMLGAPPLRVWKEIDLSLITRAGLVAAGFAFAISLGEFGASAFLVRPDNPTMPTAIFRLLGQPGAINFGRAMAMSTILMALTALSIAAIERFRLAETSEF